MARSSRWEPVPQMKAFARACPKCGAAAYNFCRRVRADKTTGGPDDGGYLIRLKTLHAERRRKPEGR